MRDKAVEQSDYWVSPQNKSGARLKTPCQFHAASSSTRGPSDLWLDGAAGGRITGRGVKTLSENKASLVLMVKHMALFSC